MSETAEGKWWEAIRQSIIHAVGIVKLLARAWQLVTNAVATRDINKVHRGDELPKLSKSARESITELLLLSYIGDIWEWGGHFHYRYLPKDDYLHHLEFVISCSFLWGISWGAEESILNTLGRYVSGNAPQSSALAKGMTFTTTASWPITIFTVEAKIFTEWNSCNNFNTSLKVKTNHSHYKMIVETNICSKRSAFFFSFFFYPLAWLNATAAYRQQQKQKGINQHP